MCRKSRSEVSPTPRAGSPDDTTDADLDRRDAVD
jgi:hypothetical protein